MSRKKSYTGNVNDFMKNGIPKGSRPIGILETEGDKIGFMDNGEQRYRLRHLSDGEVEIIDWEPVPLTWWTKREKKCPLEQPEIDWPSSARDAPKGELIGSLYGDDGWKGGKLLPEIEELIGRTIEPLTTTHDIGSWTAPFCAKICCTDCQELKHCTSFGAQVARTQKAGKRDMGTMFGQTDPLERRIEPYYYALVKQKDARLKRAIIILAILGEGGMRKGGYYKNDIARIAGINPKNQNSKERIIVKLTE